jgi:hypothetical protein
MEQKLIKSDAPYSLIEAAHVMGLSRQDVEGLIRQKRLGFEMSDYGPVISRKQISDYYLGYNPYEVPDYKSERLMKKPRKKYPKARTWR